MLAIPAIEHSLPVSLKLRGTASARAPLQSAAISAQATAHLVEACNCELGPELYLLNQQTPLQPMAVTACLMKSEA